MYSIQSTLDGHPFFINIQYWIGIRFCMCRSKHEGRNKMFLIVEKKIEKVIYNVSEK